MINLILLFVVIFWDANTEVDLAGYKIYYGQASQDYSEMVDVGLDTTYNLDLLNLSDGKWYFAVTAYDTVPNESGYSEEVSTFIGDTVRIDKWDSFFGDVRDETRGFVIYGGESGFTIDSQFAIYDLSFDLQMVGEGSCLDQARLVTVGGNMFFASTIIQSYTVPNMSATSVRFYFDDDCWIEAEPSDANILIKNIMIIRSGKRPMKNEFLKLRLK